MKKVELKFIDGNYDVVIKDDLLNEACDYIYKVYNQENIFIITDKNVGAIYKERLTKNLETKFKVHVIEIEPGEDSKCIDTYQDVVEHLLNLKIRRNELLVALGGGVVGDLTGFIAGTLYRGIPYINIPTSLLAQVDSSIGGKTGIDFYTRKNILGMFKQPLLVLIDPKTLDTLPKEEFSNGMAELIKHAFIGDSKLVDDLLKNPKIDEDIIYRSLLVKRERVLKDEYDTAGRMILNFGHTFGHAIELKQGLKHGFAVGLGMIMAVRLGINLGITDPEIMNKLVQILSHYDLDTTEHDYHKYFETVVYDKKNLAGQINFILLEGIAKPIIYPVEQSKIKDLV